LTISEYGHISYLNFKKFNNILISNINNVTIFIKRFKFN
jgi:hypothetical protein